MRDGLAHLGQVPLTGRARIAAVIGWPVAHSLSPRLHGYWLRRYGIDGAYVPLAVRPEAAPEVLRMLPKLGLAGANVTVPHKEAALAAAGRLSPDAVRIGAVNTLVVATDGVLEGDNSDGFGFIQNLRAASPEWHGHGSAATVIGAGGAARAICDGLLNAGVAEIRVVNRNPARSDALAVAFGSSIHPLPWGERSDALDGIALLVNATTLGMQGEPLLDLSLDRLPPSAAVADVVYTPLRTPLLAEAAARGHRTIDGLGMLLHQARVGFSAWFGIEPEVTVGLRAHVLEGLCQS